MSRSRSRQFVQTPILVLAMVAMVLGTMTLAQGSSVARAIDPPEVSILTPDSGSAGTSVQIYGSNLAGATSVEFGGAAASFIQISSSRIQAIAPTHALGEVDVIVTTAGGESLATEDSVFEYIAGPIVTGLSPNSGRPGTLVTVSGSGFSGATSVNFGGVALTPSVFNDSQLTVAAPTFAVGSVVNVRVTTPSGTSIATNADRFTYLPGPTVTDVAPSAGSAGTQVTISGSGFTGATVVQFGANNVVATVISDGTVTAFAPAGAAGTTVDVRVVTANGPSPVSPDAKFTYATGPIVTSLSPVSGNAATLVTILGSGFTNASSISFGGTNATPVTVTDSVITVSAPVRPLGTVNVTVTTPLGTSLAHSLAQFTYTGIPVITSLSPSTGTIGTTVTITGSGFVGATSVTFDGVSAVFTVVTNGQIVATAPTNTPGSSNVRVTSPTGISDLNGASIFTYTGLGNLPVITSVSPATGTSGTTVTINGSNLSGATSVSFGGTLAVPVVVNSGQIVVTAPSRAPGTVILVVTTPNGSSTSTAFTFAYTGATALPAITSISPTSGTAGTTVTINGTNFSGATLVSFGGTLAVPSFVSSTQIVVTAPSRAPGVVTVIVTTPNGSSTSTAFTFTYMGSGETITYTLNFRWSLIVWLGPHGANIETALKGELPSTAVLTNVYQYVSAIFRWNGTLQKWEASFPGSANIPGANDFTVFDYGVAYWVATDTNGSFPWTVPVQ